MRGPGDAIPTEAVLARDAIARAPATVPCDAPARDLRRESNPSNRRQKLMRTVGPGATVAQAKAQAPKTILAAAVSGVAIKTAKPSREPIAIADRRPRQADAGQSHGPQIAGCPGRYGQILAHPVAVAARRPMPRGPRQRRTKPRRPL
ncbi:MAG: hypothetical protein AAGC92_07400 [Pseudomonadota bacterium]